MTTTILRSLALLAALTPALVGCGRSEPRVPVVAVTGKVSFQGQAPAGAQIVLHSVSPKADSQVAPSGTVKDDGTFQISAYDQADGAPPGEYVATIQWFRIVQTEGGGGRGPNVLPATYSDPATSPIKVKVENSATQLDPIEIR
jgi:hypothetical protein